MKSGLSKKGKGGGRALEEERGRKNIKLSQRKVVLHARGLPRRKGEVDGGLGSGKGKKRARILGVERFV